MTRKRYWMLPASAWSVTLALTGVISLAGLILQTGLAAGAAPRAVAPEITYNFGKVFEDRALVHTFVIKNEGTAPLRVEDVDPDCACTVANYDPVIPAGGEGQINLSIKPYSVLRDFLKHTKVQLNDPARSELVLTMKGYVQPIIEIQPSHIIRLRGTVDQDLRGEVRFISHLSQPWEILKYVNSIPGIIEVKVKAEKPGKVYVLEVKNLRREAGHYAGKIDLFTSSKQRPRMLVRVFANLYPSASRPGEP
jgi:hypothetical protein